MNELKNMEFSRLLDTPVGWLSVAYVGLTIAAVYWADFAETIVWLAS